MRWVLGAIVFLLVVIGGTWLLMDYAWDTDTRNAEQHCASLGAEPSYTYRTRYICITPDGRVVE